MQLNTDEKNVKLMQALLHLNKTLGMNNFEVGFDQNGAYAVIQIGSKTGSGKLYPQGTSWCFVTRYEQTDYFDYEDDLVAEISSIAWGWYKEYMSSGSYSTPSEYWRDLWIEEGRLKTVQETKYVLA